MDSLLNASGQQLPNNHFVDSQVKAVEKFIIARKTLAAKHKIQSQFVRPAKSIANRIDFY